MPSIKEIIQEEATNAHTIHLHSEGVFWKAYQRSAASVPPTDRRHGEKPFISTAVRPMSAREHIEHIDGREEQQTVTTLTF